MNVVRLDGDRIWTETAEVERLDLGLLADAEIKDDVLISSCGCFTLETERFESEAEVIEAWNALYPNGKPKPEPSEPVPTEVEVLKIQMAEQNQVMSDLMDLIFTSVPELTTL